ncbi:hypothetical protein L1N85_08710 [Paenibacillus alkaliterrae]|uniref:hypothetical protein n=1 Tax=Paenibacillus alkaliterrae TaxID=320909 RepID=UPI001F25E6E5|nr:hypothetical protein [Paenibacillus alkaliterrae]MCF2938514.1 hypothetical protein [Paenibacillus alkaliterrae]
MQIKIEGFDGKMLDVRQMDQDTFIFRIDNQEYKILITEDRHGENDKITDAIFSNDEILMQLHGSEMESDEDLIMSKDEFLKVIREAQ